MRINDAIVVTPMDNPGQFDPDWRNSVALGIIESGGRIDPTYSRYQNDIWIRKQVSYLRAMNNKAQLTKEQALFRMAHLWFQGTAPSDVRFRLEPLLLTAVPYSTIAFDILGSDEDAGAIKAYEKLYFNIRDNEGRLSRSCQLRQYFALPSGRFDKDTPPEQMWKMIGSLMGYDTLVSVWMWKDAHGIVNNSQEYLLDEMWRLAQSRLFMSMFADRVGHESMAKLLSAISAQQKLLKEGNGGSVDLNMINTMQNMLGLVAPSVIDAVATEVDRKAVEQATADRLSAIAAVDSVDLGTTGKNGVNFIPTQETTNVIQGTT